MKSKSPSFQFYPADWLTDIHVRLMSQESRGMYITLLCFCWMEESLPTDQQLLQRLVGCSEEEWNKHSAPVLERFVTVGDRFRHKRLDEERQKQDEYHRKCRKAGKASAVSRRSRFGSADPRTSREHTPEQQDEHNVNSSSSSSSSNKYPQPPTGAIAPIPPNGHRRLTVNEVFPDAGSDDGPSLEADLAERWTKLYAECRNGAMYRPHPVHDYGAFKELVLAYPDPAHLDEMIRFFLRADDLPAWAATRSPKCFLRLAPETDAAVRGQRR